MILEAVLLWSHHVPAFILGHLYLPLPGGGGGARVDVDVDLVALVRGGHPHVLASVVAADGGRVGESRVGDGQGVRLFGQLFYSGPFTFHCHGIVSHLQGNLLKKQWWEIVKYTPLAVPCLSAVGCHSRARDRVGRCEHHRVEVYPQLADVRAGGTECVGAGVLVSAGGVCRDDGVGVVGAGAAATRYGEHTTHSE